MTYDIFFGIDGTGPYSDTEYAQQFAQSYVRQWWNSNLFTSATYLRGPGTDGISTGVSAQRAAAKVAEKVASLHGKRVARVFLAGYSRGGAAVIEAAHHLKVMKITVHGLFLFDAVDRSLTIDKTVIPSNVCFSRHAMRDPAGESRGSFGNCGTSKQGNVNAKAMTFLTTHGGMGGTPWGNKAVRDGKIDEGDDTISGALRIGRYATPLGFVADQIYNYARMTRITPAQEATGSKQVWRWMQGELSYVRSQHAETAAS